MWWESSIVKGARLDELDGGIRSFQMAGFVNMLKPGSRKDALLTSR